jgi:hypothetical protein
VLADALHHHDLERHLHPDDHSVVYLHHVGNAQP